MSPREQVRWQICSSCVQELLYRSKQAKLELYEEAIEVGNFYQADAVQSFL